VDGGWEETLLIVYDANRASAFADAPCGRGRRKTVFTKVSSFGFNACMVQL
jgi:hypothetical protein